MNIGLLHPLLAFGICVLVCLVGLVLPIFRSDFPLLYVLAAISGGIQFVLTWKRQASHIRHVVQVVAAAVLAPSIIFYGAFFIHVVVLGRPE